MPISRFVLFLTLLISLQPAAATTVLPLPLQKMSQSSQVIFYGKAINNEVKLDQVSGRVATFTTFEVLEIVKGTPTDSYTIKQVGGRLPDSNIVYRFYGVPHFNVGEEYVIFLPEPSKHGFSSPVGLSQGRFSVLTVNGSKIVTNGRAVDNLLPAQQARAANVHILQALPDRPAATQLDNFLQTVRDLVR